MGAWGAGIFENDDAADWVYDFEGRGPDAVDEALSATLAAAGEGYLEAPDASIALAAAEAVAAAHGQPSNAPTPEMAASVEKHGARVRGLQDILTRSRHAVVAVFGKTADGKGTESELLDLWSEEGVQEADFEGFKAAVTDLALRLKAASS